MTNTNLEHLYLIDPLTYYPNDEFSEFINKNGGFDILYKNITHHLEDHKNKYSLLRVPSIEVSNNQIPDGSLDAVFIDGDHSYDAVCKDLKFWWDKLKSGGWMLGDDYKSCHPGVTKAVNEFAKLYKLNLEFLYKNSTSKYPIYKFIKP